MIRIIIVVLKLVLVLLLIAVGGVSWLWWMMGGRLWASPETCPKGHLATTISCVGKSEPGFQNSGGYFYIAWGKPRPEFCSSFLQNIRQLDADAGKNCPGWNTVDCADILNAENYQCYQCGRPAINGNTYYHFWAAVSSDCAKGAYVTTSGYTPESVKKRINGSMK